MTRETKVGLGVVAVLVGFIGWSVAEGVASRPQPTDIQASAATEDAAAPVAEAQPAKASDHDCCKGKAHHGDHADCKMKKAETAAAPKGDPAKCPFLSGKAVK
jgi:hypothetical protein